MNNTCTCNICGSTDANFFIKGKDRLHKVTDKEFTYVKCSSCGLVYMCPQITPEEVAKYYPSDYGPFKEESYQLIADPVTKLVRSLYQKFATNKTKQSDVDSSKLVYLDFGCGGGVQLEKVRESHPNWSLSGVDVSKDACEAAREKGFEVYCGTAQDINLPENHFDIINLSHVVEHLHDPKEVISILYKSLKPGGKIILATPNINSLTAKLFGKYWYGLEAPRHTYLFEPATLERLLQDVGFKEVSCSYYDLPKFFIFSFYYLIGHKSRKVHRVVWFVLARFSRVLARFGKTGAFVMSAKKL